MKFKVRIISKAARDGIRLYVVTDNRRSNRICNVTIHTGKTTTMLIMKIEKNEQVIKEFCKPFGGSLFLLYNLC